MKFRSRCCVGLVATVFLLGTMYAASVDSAAAEITVLVNNRAGISRALLTEAEAEAGRIFRAAGIDIAWVNCSRGAAVAQEVCRSTPGDDTLVLQIVSTGKTSSDLVFGAAFLAQDGTGKYSDIFYDRLEHAQIEFGRPLLRLLGAVAAHELGHLLLGSHAHSYTGIMMPVWREEVLRHMEMGSLLFTRDQAFQMKARIREGKGPWSPWMLVRGGRSVNGGAAGRDF